MVLIDNLVNIYFFLYLIPSTTHASHQIQESFDLKGTSKLSLRNSGERLRKRSFKEVVEGQEAVKETQAIDESALHVKSTTEGPDTRKKLEVPSNEKRFEDSLADSAPTNIIENSKKEKQPKTLKKGVTFKFTDSADSDPPHAKSTPREIDAIPGRSILKSSKTQPSDHGIETPPSDQKGSLSSPPEREKPNFEGETIPGQSELRNDLFNENGEEDMGFENNEKPTGLHEKNQNFDDGKYSEPETASFEADQIIRARAKNKMSFEQLNQMEFQRTVTKIGKKLEQGFKHSWNWLLNFIARRQRDPQTGRVPQAEGLTKWLLFKDAPNHRGETVAERLERLGRSGRLPHLSKPAHQMKPDTLPSKAS